MSFFSRENLPLHVTRETASGYTGAYYAPAWLATIIVAVVICNIIGWGVYGIVELAGKVI